MVMRFFEHDDCFIHIAEILNQNRKKFSTMKYENLLYIPFRKFSMGIALIYVKNGIYRDSVS